MDTFSIDILLNDLEQLSNWGCVKPLTKWLVVLRRFVERSHEILYAHAKVKNLVPRIRDVADKAETFIIRHIFGDSEQRDERWVEIVDLLKNLDRIRKAIVSMNSGFAEGKKGTVSIELLLKWLEQLMKSDLLLFDPGEPINNNLDSIRLILLKKVNYLRHWIVRQGNQNVYAREKAKYLLLQMRDVFDEAEVDIVRYLFSASEQSSGRSAELLVLIGNLNRFDKEIDSIITELVEIYGLGETTTVSIDIRLENLKQLIVPRKPIDDDLDSFRLILDWLVKIKNLQHQLEPILDVPEKVRNLVPRIREMTDKVIFDWHTEQIPRPSIDLCRVTNEICSICTNLVEIYGNKIYDTHVLGGGNSYDGGSSSRANIPVLEEVVVGFDDEAEKIKEILAGAQRNREAITIVGMGGLGKTTLARKVYNDPYIAYHFYVRAWTYVSQVYQKRAVLLGILSCLVEKKDDIENNWSAEMMEEKVYRCLKVEYCSPVGTWMSLCIPDTIDFILCVFLMKMKVGI